MGSAEEMGAHYANHGYPDDSSMWGAADTVVRPMFNRLDGDVVAQLQRG